MSHYDRLTRIHDLRMRMHWGDTYEADGNSWPASEAVFRETHAASPWYRNVVAAQKLYDMFMRLHADGVFDEES